MGIRVVADGLAFTSVEVAPSLVELLAKVVFATVDSIVTSKVFTRVATVLSTRSDAVIIVSGLVLGGAVTAYAAMQDDKFDETEEAEAIEGVCVETSSSKTQRPPEESSQQESRNPFKGAIPDDALPKGLRSTEEAQLLERPLSPPAQRNAPLSLTYEELSERSQPSLKVPLPKARTLVAAVRSAVLSTWYGYMQHSQNVQHCMRVTLYVSGQSVVVVGNIADWFFSENPDWVTLYSFGGRLVRQPVMKRMGNAMDPWREVESGPSTMASVYKTGREFFQWLETGAARIRAAHQSFGKNYYGEKLDPYIEVGQEWTEVIRLVVESIVDTRIGQKLVQQLEALDVELNESTQGLEDAGISPEDRIDKARIMDAIKAFLRINWQICQLPIQAFRNFAKSDCVQQEREQVEAAAMRVVIKIMEGYEHATQSMDTEVLSSMRRLSNPMQEYAEGAIKVLGWDDDRESVAYGVDGEYALVKQVYDAAMGAFKETIRPAIADPRQTLCGLWMKGASMSVAVEIREGYKCATQSMDTKVLSPMRRLSHPLEEYAEGAIEVLGWDDDREPVAHGVDGEYALVNQVCGAAIGVFENNIRPAIADPRKTFYGLIGWMFRASQKSVEDLGKYQFEQDE